MSSKSQTAAIRPPLAICRVNETSPTVCLPGEGSFIRVRRVRYEALEIERTRNGELCAPGDRRSGRPFTGEHDGNRLGARRNKVRAQLSAHGARVSLERRELRIRGRRLELRHRRLRRAHALRHVSLRESHSRASDDKLSKKPRACRCVLVRAPEVGILQLFVHELVEFVAFKPSAHRLPLCHAVLYRS